MEKQIDLKIIHKAICLFFNIELEKLFEKRKHRSITIPRQWFYYFARRLNSERVLSLEKIGQYFEFVTGNTWGHSSVLFAVNSIGFNIKTYKSDAETEEKILKLIERLVHENIEEEFKRQLENKKRHFFCQSNSFKITRTKSL